MVPSRPLKHLKNSELRRKPHESEAFFMLFVFIFSSFPLSASGLFSGLKIFTKKVHRFDSNSLICSI